MALSKEEQRRKYITGDYKSLRDFAEREGINYSYLRQYANGWGEERKKYNLQVTSKTLARTAAKTAEKEASLNARLLNVSEKFIAAFEDMSAEEIKEAMSFGKNIAAFTSALLNLQKVHRTAEGLDVKKEETSGEDGVKIVIERKVVDLSKNKRGESNAD